MTSMLAGRLVPVLDGAQRAGREVDRVVCAECLFDPVARHHELPRKDDIHGLGLLRRELRVAPGR